MFKKQIEHILNEDDLRKAVAIVRSRAISNRGRWLWYVKTSGKWYVRLTGQWIDSKQPVEGTCEIYNSKGDVENSGWTDEWQHWLRKA